MTIDQKAIGPLDSLIVYILPLTVSKVNGLF